MSARTVRRSRAPKRQAEPVADPRTVQTRAVAALERLQARYEVLRREHAALEEEFRRLRLTPKDVEAHKKLVRQLRAHLRRLHRYTAAVHATGRKR